MQRYLSLTATLLFVLVSAAVEAETLICTPITSVPVTISRPGIYCLMRDLVAEDVPPAAIVIDSDQVVLDLNAHRLSVRSAGDTQSHGITTSSQRRNITVKNGTVIGFRIAVDIRGSNNVVEGIRADRNTEGGIGAVGNTNIIRDNHVLAVNRSQGLSWGIYVDGERNVIMNNDVADVNAQDDNEAGIILSNFSGNGRDFLVVNNRIIGMREGIRFEHGATGKYRDNLTSGVTTPFSGGTDAGGNN